MGTGALAGMTQPRPRLRAKYWLFGFIGLMFGYVLVTRETFLINPHDPRWLHIASFKWWLLPHGLAGATALLIAPMQFSDRLRRRFIRLHRALGRIYIGGVFIAAPLGVYIQHLDERLGCSATFTLETALQASMWMLTTGIALACIRSGKIQQHRQWMARSFAAGPFVFIEVRVIAGLFNLHGCPVGEYIVWGCTATSIFLADAVLQVEELIRNRPLAAKV